MSANKYTQAIRAADQLTVKALRAELDDARAKIAEKDAEISALQSLLAESRTNDMAAMRWLCDARFASGDNGTRMLPEFIEYLSAMKAENEQLNRYIFENGEKL